MDQLQQQLEPDLAKVISALFDAVVQIAAVLRTPATEEVGTLNEFGDRQLKADVQSDAVVFEALRLSGVVAHASSEETTELQCLGGSSYSVAFDPLDGSSIIDANWAVGSIFGIWPGANLLKQTGRQQVAAAYAVYGPRTCFVLARPASPGSSARVVQEFVLTDTRSWASVRDRISIGNQKVFAPANLRCAAENTAYRELIAEWMEQKMTLRYSGGMVPDVHHILHKGGGIFCSPASPSAKAKLRLLYECAPLSYITEAAGGTSHDGNGSVLDQEIDAVDKRTVIALGSSALVQACIGSLQSSLQSSPM